MDLDDLSQSIWPPNNEAHNTRVFLKGRFAALSRSRNGRSMDMQLVGQKRRLTASEEADEVDDGVELEGSHNHQDSRIPGMRPWNPRERQDDAESFYEHDAAVTPYAPLKRKPKALDEMDVMLQLDGEIWVVEAHPGHYPPTLHEELLELKEALLERLEALGGLEPHTEANAGGGEDSNPGKAYAGEFDNDDTDEEEEPIEDGGAISPGPPSAMPADLSKTFGAASINSTYADSNPARPPSWHQEDPTLAKSHQSPATEFTTSSMVTYAHYSCSQSGAVCARFWTLAATEASLFWSASGYLPLDMAPKRLAQFQHELRAVDPLEPRLSLHTFSRPRPRFRGKIRMTQGDPRIVHKRLRMDFWGPWGRHGVFKRNYIDGIDTLDITTLGDLLEDDNGHGDCDYDQLNDSVKKISALPCSRKRKAGGALALSSRQDAASKLAEWKKQRTLLGQCREIKSHIFGFLFGDMHVTSYSKPHGKRRARKGDRTILLNNKEWYDLFSARRVSKEFNLEIVLAFRWATQQQHIHLVADTRDASQKTTPPHNFKLMPTPPGYKGCRIPEGVLGNFTSLRISTPVLGTYMGPTPLLGRFLSRLTMDIQQPLRSSKLQITSVEVLPVHPQARSYVETMMTAEINDQIAKQCRDFDTEKDWRIRLGVAGGMSTQAIFNFLTMVGRSMGVTVRDVPSAVIEHTLHALHYEELIPRLNNQASLGGTSEHYEKLGWRGGRYASGVAKITESSQYSDGVSFLTKWKPCLQLINARRVEEGKLVKLGWHSSRALAEARMNQCEPDGDQIVLLAEWLAGLDVAEEAEVKLAWRGSWVTAAAIIHEREQDADELEAVTKWLLEL